VRVLPSGVLLAGLIAFLLIATGIPGAGPSHPGMPSSPAASIEPTSSAHAVPHLSMASGTVSWPTYLGSPERTGSNPFERTIAPSNVSNLTQQWSFSTNGSDLSAPIVVNGTVYFGSWNGYEYALRASNGTPVWSKLLGFTSDCYVGGIDSTPAYSNGTLYLGTGNGSWDAVNASNGSVDWSYFVGSPSSGYFDWASALVFGHSLYIGAASCLDQPLIPGRLIEVNLTGNHTANHTWHAVSSPQVGSTIWSTSSADPATNTIWVTTGNDNGTAEPYAQSVVALNATTLGLRGSYQVPNLVGSDSDFGSTPTLVNPSNGPPLVVATNKNGYAYAFNRSNVTTSGWGPVWSLFTGGGFSGGAFDGTTLFLAGAAVGDVGTVFAVNPLNGSVKWQTALTSGYVYATLSTANGVVYVGAGSTEYAIDGSSGQILWNYTTPGGESIFGESIAVNGRLFVPSGLYGSAIGHLTAFGLPFAVTANGTVPNGISAPGTAQFRASATGGMTPYSFAWSFDDGGNASGPTVNHSFAVVGNHSAHLSVTDSTGRVREANVSVVTTLPPPPLRASIRISEVFGEAPFSVWLNGSEVNGTGPAYLWSWNFGDNSTGTGPFVRHSYGVGGTFSIVLNVSESDGRFALANAVVRVFAPLRASATASPSLGIAPLATELSAGPSGGRGPYDVAWTFGDGSTGETGSVVNHTYGGSGNFTATANVTDTFGIHVVTSVVVATTSAPPSVGPRALVAHPSSWLVAQHCQPNTATFRLTANDSGGIAPRTDHWSFGDGSSSATGSVVEHPYSANAPYTASLTVLDANGTTATAMVPLFAPPANCSHPATSPSPNVGLEELALSTGVALVLLLATVLVLRRRRPK
jgi:outer membrane protein assembly factor BamB